MSARLLFHEKRILVNEQTQEAAVAELRVWQVQRSRSYPQGRRYSLFLVVEGKIILGFDNHSPKGPHLHIGNEEVPYAYTTDEKLLADFWELSRKAGFEL